MEKDFDAWNELKKQIDGKKSTIFCNTREIWWASIGLNVGSEENGKNMQFERPVLVLRVFNRDMIRIIPLTSNLKNDRNHALLALEGIKSSALLTHIKTISPKRLTRKIGRLGESQFQRVAQAARQSLL